jgi:hypothetical protein
MARERAFALDFGSGRSDHRPSQQPMGNQMVRRPSWEREFGTKSRPRAKDPPAPRNPLYEGVFCDAIRQRLLVVLRYNDDTADRTFAPHAVFYSRQDKVCVSGTQITTPSKPQDSHEPHNFEVGKVRSVSLTDHPFTAHSWFDPNDAQYEKGMICHVRRT